MADMQQFNDLENQIRETVRVPDANPEFVAHLRGRLDRLPAPQKQPWFILRPAWVVAIVLAVLLIAASLPGAANAIRQVFGFIPGIGLVEQSSPQRVLESPIAVTRDGVTLTIQQVIDYADRVELAYRVDGLSTTTAEPSCSGADMYPYLTLPDGTRINAKPMALGGERPGAGYIAGHAFTAPIPSGVSSASFHLKCLQEAKRGAAPEDWSIPFTLTAIPQGKPIGDLLEASNAPQVVQPAELDTTVTFLGGAQKENGYHFFFRFSAQNSGPDFLSVRPFSMYLIDSSGQRIELINALPWSPFDTVDIWDYRAVANPAAGPVTLFIDGVQVFYQAQAASFEFETGKDARAGQTWKLDEHFNIGGVDFSVTSASMIELEGHKGFEFVIEANQPDSKISAEVMDMTSNDPRFQMWSITRMPEPAQSITTGFVYESAVPENLRVTFNTISALKNGVWKVEWTPPQP